MTPDTTRDQRVPRLDCYQPTEPTAKHKDWPDPQGTPSRKENDANPANCICVENPEPLPVCVGRKISIQQPDQHERYEDPAVGAIFAFAGVQISATEQRHSGKHKECDRKDNSGRMGEKSGSSAPT
jgi:hypothetical protein